MKIPNELTPLEQHVNELEAEISRIRTTLEPVGFFATPDDWDDLQTRLEQLSGTERATATAYAVMAWNLAAKVVHQNADQT